MNNYFHHVTLDAVCGNFAAVLGTGISFVSHLHTDMSDVIYNTAEYLRPWKLVTLSIGLALLALGSYYTPAPDWDIPVSVIMATFTYLSAPWSMRVILERKWRS